MANQEKLKDDNRHAEECFDADADNELTDDDFDDEDDDDTEEDDDESDTDDE